MRQSNRVLLFIVTLFLLACGSSVNPVVVEEVEKEVQAATESVEMVRSTAQQFTDFKLLVERAPASVKEAAGGRIEEMAQMIGEYTEKTAVNVEPLEAMLKEAKQFEADYAAGKIKEAEAKPRLAQIKANLTHVNQTSREFKTAFEAFHSEYKKMVEDALKNSVKSEKK